MQKLSGVRFCLTIWNRWKKNTGWHSSGSHTIIRTRNIQNQKRTDKIMALWAGRFSKEIDAGVNAFNSSIAFDARMYRHDIQGSIAHATMLGDCGIISKEDSKTIIEGLTAILADLDSGKLAI